MQDSHNIHASAGEIAGREFLSQATGTGEYDPWTRCSRRSALVSSFLALTSLVPCGRLVFWSGKYRAHTAGLQRVLLAERTSWNAADVTLPHAGRPCHFAPFAPGQNRDRRIKQTKSKSGLRMLMTDSYSSLSLTGRCRSAPFPFQHTNLFSSRTSARCLCCISPI